MSSPENLNKANTKNNNSPWGESYTKDLPSFSGSKIEEAESVERTPSIEEMNDESIAIIKGALSSERFNPKENFELLQEYARLRGVCLGIEKPVNLFLRYEDFVKTPNGSIRRKTRIDPVSDKPFAGKWGWDTRAFHAEDGTYLDFTATPDRESNKPIVEQVGVLGSYEKAYELVSFMYTCEHELQHDVQDQRIKNKEISYDALRIAKDWIVLKHLLPNLKDGEYFYANAHDDFYIEDDANKTASEFLYQAIPVDSNLAKTIVNPEAPVQYQYNLLSVCLSREKEGQTYHKEYDFRVPENQIRMPVKEYRGSAEEIISNLCDDAIALYPNFLKAYPTLALEYNQDGTRRSLEEIKDAMSSLPIEGKQEIGGQKIPVRNLRVAYHKIMKNLRQREVASE